MSAPPVTPDGRSDLGARRYVQIILLVLMCWNLTAILQYWVGGDTIYAEENRAARAELHNAILDNSLPAGKTWEDLGANATNTRVFAVYLAEGLTRWPGFTIHRAYWVIDSVFMFVAFLLLFVYLSHWFSALLSTIGVLYVAAVFVLTYQLFYFHPWDRVSLVAWLLALMAARARRGVVLAVVLAIAMTVKYDILLFPVLYGSYLAWSGSRRRALWSTAGLFAVTYGALFVLRTVFPEGGSPVGSVSIGEVLSRNVSDLVGSGWAYPPLLAFSLPLLLVLSRLRPLDKFIGVSALFGVFLLPVYMTRALFIEVRTEIPILVLLLPAALLNLQYWLDRHGDDRLVLGAPAGPTSEWRNRQTR